MGTVDGSDDGSGYGVGGYSPSGDGVLGGSPRGRGVFGASDSGTGVLGQSDSATGVIGQSDSGLGVIGRSKISSGVNGSSGSSYGVWGYSDSGASGVLGQSGSGDGVIGTSDSGFGMYGISPISHGVVGKSDSGDGVHGTSDSLSGVYGESNSGVGVYGLSNGSVGIYASSRTLYAAYLDGSVYIRGPLYKPGGSFKIDHPRDPANKYLSHSFVESPDMKNVYDGVVELDDNGEAEIKLPDWFGALNKDFRYQLTAIGAPGPNLYIAEEIISETTTAKHGSHDDDSAGSNNNGNRIKIAGGESGMKVSWQVTGIRRDPWANAHRIQVEEDKPDEERGHYLYPDLYDQPQEKGISRLLFPKDKEQELLIRSLK
jgi:hypothetical protein